MSSVSSVASEKPIASAVMKDSAASAKFENWPSDKILASLQGADLSSPIKHSLASDNRVAVIQRALIYLGFLSAQGNRDSKGGPDGKFGNRTLLALQKMREKAGSSDTSKEITKNDIASIRELMGDKPAESVAATSAPLPAPVPVAPISIPVPVIVAEPSQVSAAMPRTSVAKAARTEKKAASEQAEASLAQRIIGASKKADCSIDRSQPHGFVLNAINSAFCIDRNDKQSEKSVMIMAKETFTADYLAGVNDPAGALRHYENILKFFKVRSKDEMTNLGNDADRITLDLARYYVDNAEIRSAEIRFELSSANPHYYSSAMRAVDGFFRDNQNDSNQDLQARYIKAKGTLRGAALFLGYGNIQEGLTLLSEAADMIRESKSKWVGIGARYISNTELSRLRTIEKELSSGGTIPASKISGYADELQAFLVSMRPVKYPQTGFIPDKLC